MPPKRLSRGKIGIIGSINRDTIYLADDRQVSSWGGILYNIKYLAESGVGEIVPVVNAGDDAYKDIIKILKKYPNVNLEYISRVDALNNHCFLYYHNQSHKCEILKGGVPRLNYKQISPLLNCEIALVNFISGRDIALQTLEKFRGNYHGLIYMDIHSLTLGSRKVKDGFKRFLRRPSNWFRYAACADILQMNENEFEILSGRKLSRNDLIQFWLPISANTKCLNITLRREGSLVVSGKANPKIKEISPVRVSRVYDTTGCGDAFAAGFISEYLNSKNFVKSAANGNRLAAQRCGVKGKVF
ncbi:MAG: carbohydrate kinase family protein [candidate division Zixibacteria bacterium]